MYADIYDTKPKRQPLCIVYVFIQHTVHIYTY